MSESGGDAPIGKRRRWIWWALLAAAALPLALAFLLVIVATLVVTRFSMPALSFDLSPRLDAKTAALFDKKTVTFAAEPWQKASDGGYTILAHGELLDWPYRASIHVRSFLPRLKGELTLVVAEDWKLASQFDIASSRDWRFKALIPETETTQESAVVADILRRLPAPAVSNLVFGGKISFTAEGASTPKVPMPAWKAKLSLKDAVLRGEAGGKDVEIENLRASLGMEGIADRTWIDPLFPRADSVSFAGFAISNVTASVRATERSFLVTEAGASCCGGELKLYSLFLDTEKLSLGGTIFVDGVDAGEALSHVSGFHGRATGRLHGKLPFFLKDGREFRLRNAYLFSTPGEEGKVEILDAKPFLDTLGGVPQSERDNFAKVLSNLDYKVLKLELRRGADKEATLGLRIEGSATQGKTTVPVNIAVNFHGDIDQLIKTGMQIKRKGTTR